MKTYNDEEIDALVEEVKEQFLAPLLQEAKQEVLAKASSGKKAPIAGGSGMAIKGEGLGDELSAKAKSNKAPNWPVSKEESSMSKEESSGSRSGSSMSKEESSMSKDEGTASCVPPTMQEQSGGKQPLDSMPPTLKPHSGLGKDEDSHGSSKKPEASASHGAPAEAAPDDAAAPPAASEAPADPAMEAQGQDQGPGDMQSLVQAYCSLPPQDLEMHMQALQMAMQQGQQQDPGMASQAPMADPAASMGEPQQKALMMSEKDNGSLVKAEAKIQELEKTLESLVGFVEATLQPRRKAITTMTEYVAKTEQDMPVQNRKLSKAEVNQKLTQAARSGKLSKSDQDLVSRYYLNNDVKLSEIEHLLK
jgi:hypothetical protein